MLAGEKHRYPLSPADPQKVLKPGFLGFHGGPWGTVPELLFEKKTLILVWQRLLIPLKREPTEGVVIACLDE
jgi:hypothetical protein